MQTSINIKPCITQSSERHNLRHKELPHLLAVENGHESLVLADISPTLAAIKAKYLASTGQAMQKKATPIREGVVVISPTTTMDDLRRLGDAYREAFGIRAFQYHIHRDEGQSIEKRNLHAHIVFDWTDEATGKSIKLNKQRMCEMQTITAEVLGMERGHSSDIKHLNAVQFKEQAAIKAAQAAQEQAAQAINEANTAIGELKNAISQTNSERDKRDKLISEVARIEQERDNAELLSKGRLPEVVKRGKEMAARFDELAQLVETKPEERANRQWLGDELSAPKWEKIELLGYYIAKVGQAVNRMGKQVARIAKRAMSSHWIAKLFLKKADFSEFATVDDLTKQVKSLSAQLSMSEAETRKASRHAYQRYLDGKAELQPALDKANERLKAITEELPGIENIAKMRKQTRLAGISAEADFLRLLNGEELTGKVDGKSVQISIAKSTAGETRVWYDDHTLGDWRKQQEKSRSRTNENDNSLHF